MHLTSEGDSVYISELWEADLELAQWVYQSQLMVLYAEGKGSKTEMRQFWMEHCGRQLNIDNREVHCKIVAGNKEMWEKEVLAKIFSQDAKYILRWIDEEEDPPGPASSGKEGSGKGDEKEEDKKDDKDPTDPGEGEDPEARKKQKRRRR